MHEILSVGHLSGPVIARRMRALLMLQHEFAAQQAARVIRYAAQPLLQGLRGFSLGWLCDATGDSIAMFLRFLVSVSEC
jgi:hypothetical protein